MNEPRVIEILLSLSFIKITSYLCSVLVFPVSLGVDTDSILICNKQLFLQ